MNQIECFEIPNTFTRDFSLDKQIALGICDWQAQIGEVDGIYAGDCPRAWLAWHEKQG